MHCRAEKLLNGQQGGEDDQAGSAGNADIADRIRLAVLERRKW